VAAEHQNGTDERNEEKKKANENQSSPEWASKKQG
jgi:hypothetical protein